MIDAHLFVLITELGQKALSLIGADEALYHAHGARGILDPDRAVFVIGLDLDRGMRARGRGPADEQGHGKSLALHFLGHMRHFLQRWRDQPGEPDDIHVFRARGFEDLARGHHDAQVDDLKVIALQHHADDILADVVHIAFDRGHEDLALGSGRRSSFSASMKGIRWATAFFITRALLTTCGRNILPAPNRSPTTFMPSISGPSMTCKRALGLLARFFGVFDNVFGDAFYQRVRQAFFHRCSRARLDLLLGLYAVCRCNCLGDIQQAFGGIVAAIEHHVFDALQQILSGSLRKSPAVRH